MPHETATRGKQPDALITVPQPPGLYGPLLYPTSITGTAGLTLDFTIALASIGSPVTDQSREVAFRGRVCKKDFRACTARLGQAIAR